MNRAISLLALAIFLLLLNRLIQRDHPPAPPAPAPVIVDIQGAVEHPGIYLLKGPTATTADALKAAGRESFEVPDHLRDCTVTSGHLIRVVETSDGVHIQLERMGAAALLTIGMKLDVLSATVEDLCLVPRMRQEFAEAIVRYRQRNPLRSLDELKAIPGVGPKTIEKWRNHLYIPEE